MKRSVKTNPSITKFFKANTDNNNNVRDGVMSDTENPTASTDSNSTITNTDSNSKTTTSSSGKFQTKWLTLYPWLRYDKEHMHMFCTYCKDLKFKNKMAMGTNNFKTTTLQRHIDSSDHKAAFLNNQNRVCFEKSVSNADSKEYASISVCMKVVYWLAKESIPLTKYTSLMGLLKTLNTPTMDTLNVNDRINYTSYTTACDLLQSISDAIDRDITNQVQASPVLTIMTDESTDIVVHHKLVINARIVDPITLAPKTLFLTDLHITSATGKGIFNAIQSHLDSRKIKVNTITGLGTDGASVMTGRKEGLTGQFLRHNPHLVNTHCSAHRLALCSEQAAEKIPAMKYYQQILESIFYYFKKSPLRCDNVAAVQKVLDEPQLKYREVHQVRWLSFYEALDAIYRTLDSLLTYFSEATDAIAIGLRKKLSQDFFIYTTYSMMDVLQPVMKLNLFFQRKDVDIGIVQVNVDTCLKDLDKLLKEQPPETSYLHKLELDLVPETKLFKGQHAIVTSKYQAVSCRDKFISALIENITNYSLAHTMFPEKQLMTSMCILGLRPVTLLDDEQLAEWGNASIKTLADHFGNKKTHSLTNDGEKVEVSSEPLIDYKESMEEWQKLKTVVKTQGYPRDTTASLWALLAKYHKDDFPNITKLAMLALTHPVHTCDCERSFSAQNSITTPLRNRISSDHCDMLMRVIIEGPGLCNFDCKAAFNQWKLAKTRAIFK